jgi:hypothetical protein
MEGVKSTPGSHVPRHMEFVDGTGGMPASWKLALSGHTSVLIMPMFTPSPNLNACHNPLAELRLGLAWLTPKSFTMLKNWQAKS